MKLTNLSAEPTGVLHSWLPHDLEAEEIVFLPDACPGKSPLPTGTAVHTRQADWRRFAVSDCGCGMRLLKASIKPERLTQENWDAVADILRGIKGGLGDLGGGNHFLDALEPYGDGPVHFLIHTGSRAESGHVDDCVDQPDRFDTVFGQVVDWAVQNRAAVQHALERVFGGARESVNEILNSISHGTGRKMARGECKATADSYDFSEMRKQIRLPSGLQDASLRTDGPFAYRDLDECLALIQNYIDIVEHFSVIGYMGHL